MFVSFALMGVTLCFVTEGDPLRLTPHISSFVILFIMFLFCLFGNFIVFYFVFIRGCPKAYHPSCVNRDEAFFQTKGKWNCGKIPYSESVIILFIMVSLLFILGFSSVFVFAFQYIRV